MSLTVSLISLYLSVFHCLFVIHSLGLFLALPSPSPGWRLFLSWITRINCRGQMKWVLQDNDWSDGTWVPPDCGVSKLVIKWQGRKTLVAPVSFWHYECQKKQWQCAPVFLIPSLQLYALFYLTQILIWSFSSSFKQKKPQFIHKSQTYIATCTFMNYIYSWLTYISASSVIMCWKLIFNATVSLVLNDFDASLLLYKVKFLLFYVTSLLVLTRFTALLSVSVLYLWPPYLKPKETYQANRIGGITLLSSSTLLL